MSDTSNNQLFDTLRINKEPGSIFLHNTRREVTGIIVSILQGSVDIWNSEEGEGVSDPPDYHFGNTNLPVWVPVRSGQGRFTIRANSDLNEPILASIHFEGP